MTGLVVAMALLGAGESSLGVIVVRPPEDLSDTEWGILRELGATPEILLYPEAASPAEAFDFAAFEDALAQYSSHGIAVAVTITPHIRTVPWQPVVGPDGGARADRQNPFDPAFRGEWRRLHREFARRFGRDERIRRVYVAPPSYFGEMEYYMGPDWGAPEMLCYDPLAQAELGRWLEAHYGEAASAARAWGAQSLADGLPVPDGAGAMPRLDTAWLDLQEWRSGYLAALVADEVNHLTEATELEVGVKFSVGDCSVYQGTDSARCFLPLARARQVVVHSTNGHSLPDLKLAHSIAAAIGAAGVAAENDGNRHTRDELARISLNLLLSGTPELNFAHLGHLTSAEVVGSRPTETVRALADVRRYAREVLPIPRHPVVMIHSVATARVRPPAYRNRDVSHAYDPALANCGARDAWGYDWARSLALPDVLSEALVEAGGLEGRRVAILPSTGPTLLTAEARRDLVEWVEAGGTLVAFGRDSLAWTLMSPGSTARVRTEPEGDHPDARPGRGPLQPSGRLRGTDSALGADGSVPVWDRAPNRPWRPVLRDAEGAVALAERSVGRGRVLMFAGTVPAVLGGEGDAFFAVDVPRILRRVAEQAGVDFPYELLDDSGAPSTALALGYLGWDPSREVHRFVAGAYDGSDARVVFRPSPTLTGRAELLLVDTRVAKARRLHGAEVAVTYSAPSQADLYADPTNVAAQPGITIPWVGITFDLPGAVEVALGPA